MQQAPSGKMNEEMPMQKPDWDEIRLAACNRFVRHKAPHYIPLPVALTHDKFGYSSDGTQSAKSVDALSFFAATGPGPGFEWGYQIITAKSPYVAVVVGQYGVGKTELARQITEQMEDYAFPVTLAKCDGKRFEAGPLSPKETIRELFQPTFTNPEALTDEVIDEIQRAIHDGFLMLILDGLDEMIFSMEGHENFFTSLGDLLHEDDATLECRIIVTLRSEYLRSFDHANASELVSNLLGNSSQRARRHAIPFLRIDYLTKEAVTSGLERLLSQEVATEVGKYPELRELLRRPLMLRLFCDFIDDEGLKGLERLKSGVDLIESYIAAFLQSAGNDKQLADAQEVISGNVQWDLDAIARSSVNLYRRGVDYFLDDEISQCFNVPDVGEVDRFQAISKCPFFIRDCDQLHFEHRTFYEYFVARGLALHDDESSGDVSKKSGFSQFDEIVLHTDIRRFLRTMEGDSWYDRTRRSYALEKDQWVEWDHAFSLVQPTERLVKEWDRERRILLDIMTEPERFRSDRKAKEAVTEINRFLDRPLQQFHPRYLMYNLEAVSVYIKAFGWEKSVSKINDRLSQTIEELIKKFIARKLPEISSPHSTDLRAAYELLITRLLRTAKQMRYPWSKKYDRWNDEKKWDDEIGSVRPDLHLERKQILNE